MEGIAVLKFYPYRTGFVKGNTVTFPREIMKSLEDSLKEIAGCGGGNHVCYVIKLKSFPEYKQIAIMFTDFDCIIGDYVEVKRW